MSIAALSIDGERGGALKRAAVIAAALYLAIVQILSAAHAVPGKPDITDAAGQATCGELPLRFAQYSLNHR